MGLKDTRIREHKNYNEYTQIDLLVYMKYMNKTVSKTYTLA